LKYQSRAQWSPIAGLLFFYYGVVMAQKIKKRQIRQTKKLSFSPFNIYWEKKNYILLGLGLLFTVIGFYFMSLGSWDSAASLIISPIILFIAYVIIFPLSIFFKKKSETEKNQESKVDPGQS
jgi:FtsH-binding integral membrane protein